ncbi:hypothetical protein ABH931_000388 [Streptacidiphilus sp. MAP12-33]|uniref:hypothetical protein n=1 Tax=Streptacidiphilus sp. MAP12-33 TaxID=3156266 RepID=UPI003516FC5C
MNHETARWLWWAADFALTAWLITRWSIRGARAGNRWIAQHPEEFRYANSKEKSWAGPEGTKYLLLTVTAFILGIALAIAAPSIV